MNENSYAPDPDLPDPNALGDGEEPPTFFLDRIEAEVGFADENYSKGGHGRCHVCGAIPPPNPTATKGHIVLDVVHEPTCPMRRDDD
ncbi:hypothetical protein [Sinomonas sp. B1-1]|uniref:hypothetical protein n=1 Tax=Sinomonas sp. B1-1 TaxID=3141454 RepID=UPI003D2B85FF